MQTIYVLVFLLSSTGYNSAGFQIEHTTWESCKAAEAQVKRMNTYRDSACIEKQVQTNKPNLEGKK